MMTEFKGTPGPWQHHLVDSNMIIGTRWEEIAQVFSNKGKEDICEADARLIAAAPDLLAALQAMESECTINYGDPDSDDAVDGLSDQDRNNWRNARAATARALGEAQ